MEPDRSDPKVWKPKLVLMRQLDVVFVEFGDCVGTQLYSRSVTSDSTSFSLKVSPSPW